MATYAMCCACDGIGIVYPSKGTYKEKPVYLEALHFDGKNVQEVLKFTGKTKLDFITGGNKPNLPEYALINTLEGIMKIYVGDWIIKNEKGNFYPCNPNTFKIKFEPVMKESCPACNGSGQVEEE